VGDVRYEHEIRQGCDDTHEEPDDEDLDRPLVYCIAEPLVAAGHDPQQSEETVAHTRESDASREEGKLQCVRGHREQKNQARGLDGAKHLLQKRAENPEPVDIEGQMRIPS